jgi:hypothetical protein
MVSYFESAAGRHFTTGSQNRAASVLTGPELSARCATRQVESAAGGLECGNLLPLFFRELALPSRSEYRHPVHGQQAGPAMREKRQQAAALQSTVSGSVACVKM